MTTLDELHAKWADRWTHVHGDPSLECTLERSCPYFPLRFWPTVVGFTGTRSGMTSPQFQVVTYLATAERLRPHPRVVHHGDCDGSDAQMDHVARTLGIYRVAHPPVNPRLRAWCDAEETRAARDYLPRDRDVVDESDVLWATPRGARAPRSGTWYTIGYALRVGKVVVVIWPDGRVEVAGQSVDVIV